MGSWLKIKIKGGLMKKITFFLSIWFLALSSYADTYQKISSDVVNITTTKSVQVNIDDVKNKLEALNKTIQALKNQIDQEYSEQIESLKKIIEEASKVGVN